MGVNLAVFGGYGSSDDSATIDPYSYDYRDSNTMKIDVPADAAGGSYTATFPMVENTKADTSPLNITVNYAGLPADKQIAPLNISSTWSTVVGRATGDIHSYTYNTDTTSQIKVPEVYGYTANKTQADIAADIQKNPGAADYSTTVTYTPDTQYEYLYFADDDNTDYPGAVIGSQVLKGYTDQTTNWTADLPAGYELADGQSGTGSITFSPDMDGITIHVKHAHTVTHYTQTFTTNFAAGEGVDASKLPAPVVQTIDWTIDKDEATGIYTLTSDDAVFDGFNVDPIDVGDGVTYVPDQTSVPTRSSEDQVGQTFTQDPTAALEAAPNSQTITYNYTAFKEQVDPTPTSVTKEQLAASGYDDDGLPLITLTINYVDVDDGNKVIATDSITGKRGSTGTYTVQGTNLAGFGAYGAGTRDRYYYANGNTLEYTIPDSDGSVDFGMKRVITTLNYVDDDNDGAIVGSESYFDTPTWTATVPEGYELAADQADTGSVPYNSYNPNQSFSVHLVHQKTITSVTQTLTTDVVAATDDVDASKLPQSTTQTINWTITYDAVTGKYTVSTTDPTVLEGLTFPIINVADGTTYLPDFGSTITNDFSALNGMTFDEDPTAIIESLTDTTTIKYYAAQLPDTGTGFREQNGDGVSTTPADLHDQGYGPDGYPEGQVPDEGTSSQFIAQNGDGVSTTPADLHDQGYGPDGYPEGQVPDEGTSSQFVAQNGDGVYTTPADLHEHGYGPDGYPEGQVPDEGTSSQTITGNGDSVSTTVDELADSGYDANGNPIVNNHGGDGTDNGGNGNNGNGGNTGDNGTGTNTNGTGNQTGDKGTGTTTGDQATGSNKAGKTAATDKNAPSLPQTGDSVNPALALSGLALIGLLFGLGAKRKHDAED
ncbi:LPXTG cell wall anchor domain-containing protein [Lacticaseibacillus yichunensis]|nr:LPXTG cell wall anchor domain-containing protein [Lacticaseibacillus yichunensis]